MKIAVASGKGGTGKTTLSVALSLLNPDFVLADCDVEEPNSGLFLETREVSKRTVTLPIPHIDTELCDHCGRCQSVCRFGAILITTKQAKIFDSVCHSCGACSLVCPKNAIKEEEQPVGEVRVSETENGKKLIDGILALGVANPVPLIEEVQKEAETFENLIIDAPPGTSCPVIHSVKGADFCILVTEPTPFGQNDLKLAVEMLRATQIPFGVVINRADLGNSLTKDYCNEENIPVLGEIPFSRELAEAYSKGIPMNELGGDWNDLLHLIWERATELAGGAK